MTTETGTRGSVAVEFDTRNGQRGAALLVAVGILAVLLALALVFFGTSRQELRTAQNARNSVQADWLAQAGTAMAMAELQRDSVLHPTATSLDGKWRSYFNGTWFLAKDWAVNPLAPHLPRIDAEDIYSIAGPAGLGLLEQDLLYVPRAQGADPTEFSDAASPFLLSYAFDADPVDEQLHAVLGGNNALRRYGVDNNGDGLLDSYWLPVPEDLFFGGMDNNADTFIDAQEGGDGLDNDLDGDIDEADERALFVYWGGRDGRDNDGDGIIDEADEQRVFLTAPIVQRVWNDTDSNPDNHFWEELTLLDDFTVQVNLPVLEAYAADTVSAIQLEVDPTPGSPTIDVLDNDYSLINNDSFGYVYLEAGTVEYDQGTTDEENYPLRYEPINTGVYPVNTASISSLGITLPNPDLVVTASGEPVCRIAGRVAVLITDEASRANLNTAASVTYNDNFPGTSPANAQNGVTAPSPELTFASSEGGSPYEFDARLLPGVGPQLSTRLGQHRGGIPDGNGFSTLTGANYANSNNPLEWDMAFPGYGRADDDGNAFWAAIDGIDNDGDGLVDEVYEGIDEPGEFRTFRPYRNRIAESDGIDTDDDELDLEDEIGEAGDRDYLIRDSIEQITGIGTGTTANLRDLVTVHSRDRNVRSRIYNGLSEALGVAPTITAPTSGLKQDFNYGSGIGLAVAMQENWFYPRSTVSMYALNSNAYGNPDPFPRVDVPVLGGGAYPTSEDVLQANNHNSPPSVPNAHELASLARGLRVYDRALFNTPFGEFLRYFSGPVRGTDYAWLSGSSSDQYSVGFDADPELRALQLGAAVEDYRDSDHARTELTLTLSDRWWEDAVAPGVQPAITYKVAGNEGIKINELMVRPVRRLEAEGIVDGSVPTLDPNYFSHKNYPNPVGPPYTPAAMPFGPDFDYNFRTLASQLGYVPPDGALGWNRRNADGSVGVPVLGGNAIVSTDTQEIGDDPLAPTFIRPNIIQFEFAPTAQLPPGRYYMTINVTGTGGISNPDLDYAVKIANSGGDGDILDDVEAWYANPLDPTLVDPAILFGNTLHADLVVGRYNMDLAASTPGNIESGWLFLPTTSSPLDAQTTLGVTNARYNGYGGFVGFAVDIPQHRIPAEQQSLYVAIVKGSNDNIELAINFFDFSQEPDHEWIELVNVTENPVDIGDWQVEVSPGGSAADGEIFTIPTGTFVSAGGSVLLAMNKFDAHPADVFEATGATLTNLQDIANARFLNRTGIALARTARPQLWLGPNSATDVGAFDFVSEPPIPMYDPIASIAAQYTVPMALTLGDDSIFLRGSNADFLDNDGDGRPDGAIDDVAFQSRPGDYDFNAIPSTDTNKPWDRVVQLESQSDLLNYNSSVDDENLTYLARLVLGGGVLPNYPEFDIVDNDNDRGLLGSDGFDNDGDGAIDELDEGIDEGQFRRLNGQPQPGSYTSAAVNFGGLVEGVDVEYLTNENAPPRYKAFVERRFFPGENVAVTLYQGRQALGRVVDRATYNQMDVENRAISDVLNAPAGTPVLDGLTPSLWPNNTMGVDFYRSLQRKYPLYPGDLYGTSNRWEATDGNYDDWHEGTDRWFAVGENDFRSRLESGSGGVDPIAFQQLYAHGFAGDPLRANHFTRNLSLHQMTFFSTVNLGREFWSFAGARIRNRTLSSAGDLLTMPQVILWDYLDDPLNPISYSFPLGLESTPLNGAMGGRSGPFLGNAYPKDLRAALAEGTTDSIVLSVATAGFYPIWPTPGMVDSDPTLVEWNIDAGGNINYAPRGWAPVFLYSLDASGTEPLGATQNNAGGFLDPGGKRYPNLPDSYPIQLNFMLNTILPPATTLGTVAADMIPRWPLAKRAVMYVATNPPSFDELTAEQSLFDALGPVLDDLTIPVGSSGAATALMPSEALFTWSGDNAVPNGEYDVYVAAGNYLDGQRMVGMHNAGSLTAFGGALTAVVSDASPQALAAAVPAINYALVQVENAPPRSLRLDVAVFTDKNGDGQVWGGTGDVTREDLDLTENLGLKRGLEPNSDGYETYVHYGTVRVENNMLAVFVRNWAGPNEVNRVSRVILAPRRNTPGRININTAITKVRDVGGTPIPFNPLMGIPGVLGQYDPTAGFNARPLPDTANIGPGDTAWDEAFYRLVTGTISTEGILQARGARQDGFGLEFRPDGRYYLFPSELVARGDLDALARMDRLELYPRVLSPNAPSLNGTENVVERNLELALQFEEMKERYSRIAAMVTTRSDTFEIIVTAQAGIVTDEDGDGIEDWTGDEFVVLGEKKLRTVYERP